MMFTSAVSEDPLVDAGPLFLDNEFGRRDVNKFADLAASEDPVASLDMATQGERPASPRYTEIMAPLQLGDELRIALRAGGQCWGVLCLHREDSLLGFSDHDARILRRLAPHMAEGLRRAALLTTTADAASPAEVGVLILDERLSVLSSNPAAGWWLSEIADVDWPVSTELPVAVYAAAAQLKALEDETGAVTRARNVTLRTATGRWLAIHSRLNGADGTQTAVILQGASAVQTTSVFLNARGLTPAQARVTRLVLQGRSTRQIVEHLGISAHTVQEHLKAVFEKFDVRSRRELVAAISQHH